MKTSRRCGVLRIGACAALVALLATACDWAQLGAGPGAGRWAPDAGTTAAEVHSLALQWAQAAPAPPPVGWEPTEPLVRAGRVFTSRGMYIGGHLVTVVAALNRTTGDELWHTEVVGDSSFRFASVVAVQDGLVIATSGVHLIGLHEDTGALVYDRTANATIARTVVDGGDIFMILGLLGQPGRVERRSLGTGLVAAFADVGTTERNFAIVTLNSTGTPQRFLELAGSLTVLDASSLSVASPGSYNWYFDAVEGTHAYALSGSYSGPPYVSLSSIDLAFRQQRWAFTKSVFPEFPGIPDITAVGNGIVAQTITEVVDVNHSKVTTLYVFDEATGRERWHTAVLTNGRRPQLLLAGNVVYVTKDSPSVAGNVVIGAYDATNGASLWSSQQSFSRSVAMSFAYGSLFVDDTQQLLQYTRA